MRAEVIAELKRMPRWAGPMTLLNQEQVLAALEDYRGSGRRGLVAVFPAKDALLIGENLILDLDPQIGG